MSALLPYLFITVWRNDLEKISLIEVWNHRVVVNTWTAHYKYLVTDFKNLPFPIQIQLSEKQKNFLSFLFHWWSHHQILTIFKKKKIVIANVFPKLATVQGFVTPLTIQRCLKTSVEGQNVKWFQTLVKSSWEHFYHISSSLWKKWFGKYLPDQSLKS